MKRLVIFFVSFLSIFLFLFLIVIPKNYPSLAQTYTCSSSNPTGTCPSGQSCSYDSTLGMYSCIYNCSSSHTSGYCPSGQSCSYDSTLGMYTCMATQTCKNQGSFCTLNSECCSGLTCTTTGQFKQCEPGGNITPTPTPRPTATPTPSASQCTSAGGSCFYGQCSAGTTPVVGVPDTACNPNGNYQCCKPAPCDGTCVNSTDTCRSGDGAGYCTTIGTKCCKSDCFFAGCNSGSGSYSLGSSNCDASSGSCDTAIGTIKTDNVTKTIKSIFTVLLSIVGSLAVVLIIISGYRLMTSRGNPEGVQHAREQLTAAVVGLLFVIFSVVFLEAIGVDILGLPITVP